MTKVIIKKVKKNRLQSSTLYLSEANNLNSINVTKLDDYINNKVSKYIEYLDRSLNNVRKQINNIPEVKEAFYKACEINNLPTIETFLKKGYLPNTKEIIEELPQVSDKVKTLLQSKKEEDNEDKKNIISQLIACGEDLNNGVNTVKQLLASNPWLKIDSSIDEMNLLANAIKHDNTSIMKFIAKDYPETDVYEKIDDTTYDTPMSYADTDSKEEFVLSLFNKKPKSNDLDKKEEKPFKKPIENSKFSNVKSILDKYKMVDDSGVVKRNFEDTVNKLERGLKFEGDYPDLDIDNIQRAARYLIKEGEIDYPADENLKVSQMKKCLNDVLKYINKMVGPDKDKKTGKVINPKGINNRERRFFERLSRNCVLLPDGSIALKSFVKDNGRKDGLLKYSVWSKAVDWITDKASSNDEPEEG